MNFLHLISFENLFQRICVKFQFCLLLTQQAIWILLPVN